MPRTTDLRKYPPEFEHLLLRAAVALVRFDFPTSTQAMRFRHRFYAYMKLLRESGMRPDLEPAAALVQIVMSSGNKVLELAPMHDSWEGVLIREVLQLERGAPTEAAVAAAQDAEEAAAALQQKLVEIRARKASGGA